MFCEKCGKPVGDTDKFCIYCGAARLPVAGAFMPGVQQACVGAVNPGIQMNSGNRMPADPGMQAAPMQYVPYYQNESNKGSSSTTTVLMTLMIIISVAGCFSPFLDLYSHKLFSLDSDDVSFWDIFRSFTIYLDDSEKILAWIAIGCLVFGIGGILDYIFVLISPGRKDTITRYVRFNSFFQEVTLLLGMVLNHYCKLNFWGFVILFVIDINCTVICARFNAETAREKWIKKKICPRCGADIMFGGRCQNCGTNYVEKTATQLAAGLRWPEEDAKEYIGSCARCGKPVTADHHCSGCGRILSKKEII